MVKNSTLAEFEVVQKQAIEAKKKELIEKLRITTPIKTGKARSGWRSDQHGIINDVEYIDKLNRGTSKQAPAYFIEATVLSVNGVSPNGTIVTKLGPTFE